MNTDQTTDPNRFRRGSNTNTQEIRYTATNFNKFLVLLCYKMCTFMLISLALALVMPYVEIDEPPPDVFHAPG
jgi:hypothetical protein